ncbi:2-oxo-4-hydroxy-4-carboxy-5-ureidoimidazoline decarboxylase [Nocardioides speluncae]|uniref:2-oxo-4-hydroxy-4-carboxy-5-ureidoimidazoline decarboxylase n=1 Tax=Nocardioides speluncae TaxID=2670337 RepID=UPI000D695961|nr:2-oxo-4-hydroxy-4-carboxy-5-ureidoimidazoline decarboxylase [Nocardioides speluncae]
MRLDADTLLACADVPSWAEQLAAEDFADEQSLIDAADRLAGDWTDDEVVRGLAAHPRIGDKAVSLKVRGWSAQEQAGVRPSDELVEVNAAYEQRFDRVFLICATGLSGDEIIAAARQRLGNDDATEAAVVKDELRKIALLRLRKALHP